MNRPDDAKWVQLAQNGSRTAFDVLIRKYQHRIQKLIGYYMSDPHEILDITQETFLKAYDAIESFRSESSFYTWLYRIAVNTAKSHRTSFMHSEELQEFHNSETEGKTPENHLLDAEQNQAALAALETLPPHLKMTLYLREIEGLDYETISHRMGCPVGTVRSRLARARKAMKRL